MLSTWVPEKNFQLVLHIAKSASCIGVKHYQKICVKLYTVIVTTPKTQARKESCPKDIENVYTISTKNL